MKKYFKFVSLIIITFVVLFLTLSIILPTLSAAISGNVVVGGCPSDNPPVCESRSEIIKMAFSHNLRMNFAAEYGCSMQQEYTVCD